jgi:hypothetical protein
MVTLTLTFALYFLGHGRPAVIFCAPILGIAIAWLTGLGPRAIEVAADAVVVRSHLRPARRIAAADLTFQLLPGELALFGRGGRSVALAPRDQLKTIIEIAAERFPEGSLEACVEALGEVAGGPAGTPVGTPGSAKDLSGSDAAR